MYWCTPWKLRKVLLETPLCNIAAGYARNLFHPYCLDLLEYKNGNNGIALEFRVRVSDRGDGNLTWSEVWLIIIHVSDHLPSGFRSGRWSV